MIRPNGSPQERNASRGNWHYDRALYDRHGYKPADVVIHTLADVVSKNGVFLLNVHVRYTTKGKNLYAIVLGSLTKPVA